MIEQYYEEELRYLYESGREFAKAHPDRAQFLNIDSVGDRDPYVERLFEGFAFLAGRIREKLHDSFPQLTEGIINLMWPQLLHEIPSLATVQFTPRTGFLQETKILPRGSEVLSNRVGKHHTICRFMTTQDVELNPLSMKGIEKHTDLKGNEVISFHFSLDSNISWNNLAISKISVFIHAELPTALMLHECLTTSVKEAKISINNGQETIELSPQTAVTPGGITHETSILPENNYTMWGYSLLREFFVYPEKFLFFNLNGFDLIPFLDPAPDNLTFTLTLSKIFPTDKPFSSENFRLYCSPIVNLTHVETEPIVRDGLRSEYRIVADASAPGSVYTHSVTSVTGIDRITGERSEYAPMHTFKNINAPSSRSYATRFVRTAGGEREQFLIVGGDQISDEDTVIEENLSIMAWCSNGELPRDTINVGDISNPGKGFPDYIRIKNISRPTLPCVPPDDNNFLWIFQSQLSTTWASLASVETLKCFLKIYDWSRQEGRVRRIEAITDVSSSPIEMVVDSCIVRGVNITISILDSEFKDSGDIHLFGLVLSEFLGQFVSINSFLELVFILKPTEKIIKWNPKAGKRCLI